VTTGRQFCGVVGLLRADFACRLRAGALAPGRKSQPRQLAELGAHAPRSRSRCRRPMLNLLGAALCLLPLSADARTLVSSRAGDNGTFRLQVTLNNRVRLVGLVDTGATSVHFCAAIAKRLALELGVHTDLNTANGRVSANRVRIDSLTIGRIIVRDVAGVVHPDNANCNEVLIGMSALRKLSIVVIKGDRLILIGR
jgi:clan AA aspartic protease (TIGR02281 family)